MNDRTFRNPLNNIVSMCSSGMLNLWVWKSLQLIGWWCGAECESSRCHHLKRLDQNWEQLFSARAYAGLTPNGGLALYEVRKKRGLNSDKREVKLQCHRPVVLRDTLHRIEYTRRIENGLGHHRVWVIFPAASKLMNDAANIGEWRCRKLPNA